MRFWEWVHALLGCSAAQRQAATSVNGALASIASQDNLCGHCKHTSFISRAQLLICNAMHLALKESFGAWLRNSHTSRRSLPFSELHWIPWLFNSIMIASGSQPSVLALLSDDIDARMLSLTWDPLFHAHDSAELTIFNIDVSDLSDSIRMLKSYNCCISFCTAVQRGESLPLSKSGWE